MNDTLRRSCKTILVQVSRFFLRYGVKHNELQEVLKESIIEAAILEADHSGAHTTSASIANHVGLSRRVVSEIRNSMENEELQTEGSVPAGVMLKLWHNDPNYLDKQGRPISLPISRINGELSLETLAEESNCQLPLDTVVKSLSKSGAIEVLNGIASVKSRTFIMSPDDESTATYFGIAGSNLLSTLIHNTASETTSPFFERTTWVSDINESVFPRFSELVSETSVPFLELLDDWLMHRQGQIGKVNNFAEGSQVLGVGIYVFKRESE